MSARWSKDEVAYLLERVEARIPIRQIAHENGRSFASVQAKIAALRTRKRIATRRRRCWTEAESAKAMAALEAGASLKDAAKSVGRTAQALKMRLWKSGHIRPGVDRPWTANEVERALALRSGGATFASIAVTLGRTPAAVRGKFGHMARVSETPRVSGECHFDS